MNVKLNISENFVLISFSKTFCRSRPKQHRHGRHFQFELLELVFGLSVMIMSSSLSSTKLFRHGLWKTFQFLRKNRTQKMAARMPLMNDFKLHFFKYTKILLFLDTLKVGHLFFLKLKCLESLSWSWKHFWSYFWMV